MTMALEHFSSLCRCCRLSDSLSFFLFVFQILSVLTLRLAPILPIPIGAYNYVYGVTNVPYIDFAMGIFLGSIKPYLLDSYLGYFGKTIIDGKSSQSSSEDGILLLALGVSVLIGVFASQLAGETWEYVQQEIEAEKRAKAEELGESVEDIDDKGIMKDILGIQLPNFMIDLQKSFGKANEKVSRVVTDEYNAKVWNYTHSEEEKNGPLERHVDPAFYADSPEIVDRGFDLGQSIIEGFAFTPTLVGAFLKFADPLFVDEDTDAEGRVPQLQSWKQVGEGLSKQHEISSGVASELLIRGSVNGLQQDDAELLSMLRSFRSRLEKKLKELDEKLS